MGGGAEASAHLRGQAVCAEEAGGDHGMFKDIQCVPKHCWLGIHFIFSGTSKLILSPCYVTIMFVCVIHSFLTKSVIPR